MLWSAHDDNEDDLKYCVYFRGENQQEWLLLKDNLDQKFYSWDTTSMPDGAYYLKIVASDAPSNPPELALQPNAKVNASKWTTPLPPSAKSNPAQRA